MNAWAAVDIPGPVMVVLGDSVGEGRNDPDPAGGWIGWPRRLASHLNVRGDQVTNVARDGASAASVAAEQLRAVRHLRPRFVAVSCGVNDGLNGFESSELTRHLDQIFGWGQEVGATLITAAAPAPPILERPIISEFRRRRTLNRIQQFNEELAGRAMAFGAVYAAQSSLPDVQDSALWSSDGIHLNSAGHAYAAAVIAHIARDVLGEQRSSG
jgi:lysophospholipase L1-like esterase